MPQSYICQYVYFISTSYIGKDLSQVVRNDSTRTTCCSYACKLLGVSHGGCSKTDKSTTLVETVLFRHSLQKLHAHATHVMILLHSQIAHCQQAATAAATASATAAAAPSLRAVLSAACAQAAEVGLQLTWTAACDVALELATLTTGTSNSNSNNNDNSTKRSSNSSSSEGAAAMSALLKQQAATLQEMCSWCSDTELLGAQRLKIETLVAVQVTEPVLGTAHNSMLRLTLLTVHTSSMTA
jgi:hypothetical protein